MRTTAKPETVEAALAAINWTHYKCNVKLRYLKPERRGCSFTITVEKPRGPGARHGRPGGRVVGACWHAHGHLFEAILELEPDAVIHTGLLGKRRITKDGGNWEDAQVGSQINPVMISELCGCGSEPDELREVVEGISGVAWQRLTEKTDK